MTACVSIRLLAAAVGKRDPTGAKRFREQDRGKALASSSTLNRLELTPVDADSGHATRRSPPTGRDRRAAGRPVPGGAREPPAADRARSRCHRRPPARHPGGALLPRLLRPLLLPAAVHLLRRAPAVRAAAPVQHRRLRGQRRGAHPRSSRRSARWPEVQIIIRGDSGFCREEIMAWCEANRVDYVLGLAKNDRLTGRASRPASRPRQRFLETKRASRVFDEFPYHTRESWSRARRVVVKAEHLAKGANPRFCRHLAEPPRRPMREDPLRGSLLCPR